MALNIQDSISYLFIRNAPNEGEYRSLVKKIQIRDDHLTFYDMIEQRGRTFRIIKSEQAEGDPPREIVCDTEEQGRFRFIFLTNEIWKAYLRNSYSDPFNAELDKHLAAGRDIQEAFQNII